MVKLSVTQSREHSDVATCVAWSPSYELYSGSDDGMIVKWKVEGELVGKTNLDALATSVAWMPSIGKSSETYAVSCVDGTIRLMTTSGREEKKIAAHHGAAIRVAWNGEGSALYSAGEDGELKIWSKSGHLRSTPIRHSFPIYGFALNGDEVCYACERKVTIASVGDRKEPTSWVAHEATVLAIDWNALTNLVVSGGEDCRYKVWDTYGRPLYQSLAYAHVITAVKWAPNGACFAVGSFELVRLCDKTGWSWCRQPLDECGSVLDLAWTPDGTQVAGATGSGTVIFAHVVDRVLEWSHFEAALKEPRQVVVQDLSNDTYENLDFSRDRVVEMALGHGHLIVATTHQLYIYSTSNWNTPYIFDSVGTVSLLVLSATHFAAVSSQLTIYGYDGRRASQPKHMGLRTETLAHDTCALSPDVVAFVDSADAKQIHCFDVASGKPLRVPTITHKTPVKHIALNQTTLPNYVRQLVMVDANNELHLQRINSTSYSVKLQSQVDTVVWHDTTETLVAIADLRLLVWAFPQIMWIDKDLMDMTLTTREADVFGKFASIASFSESRLAVRRADGPLITTVVEPFTHMLLDFTAHARWDEAMRLCKFVNDPPCWATMAAMAIEHRKLDQAEVAYAKLKMVDKLEYILYIKNLPTEETQNAELLLLKRQPEAAERCFLQAKPPLLYRAIKMNIRLFKWERALELAVKYRVHVDTVLAYRAKYLENFKKEESDDRFKQLAATVQWTWEEVKAKKDLEKQEEYTRAGKTYKKPPRVLEYNQESSEAKEAKDDDDESK